MSKSIVFPGLDDTVVRRFFLIKLILVLSNLVVPFMTLLMMEGYALDPAKVGIIVAVSSATYLAGNLAGGALADLYSPRKTSIVAIVIATVCLALLIRSSGYLSVLLLVSAYSFFVAMPHPVLNSIMSHTVAKDGLEQGFASIYISQNVAMTLVYFIGGYLIEGYGRGALLPFLAFSLLSLPVLLVLISKATVSLNVVPKQAAPKGAVKKERISAHFYGACFLFFGLAILDAQFLFLIPNWANALFPESGAMYFGYIGVINSALVVFGTAFIVSKTTHLKVYTNLGLSALFYGIGFAIILIPSEITVILISTLFWSIGEILGATYFNTYVGKHAPSHLKARMFALVPIILSAGKIVGTPLIGVVMEAKGYHVAWAIVLSTAALFFLLSLTLKFKEPDLDENRNC